MGGGILPIAIHKNKIYCLFAREYIYAKHNAGLWSDFGGSKHKGETGKQTALREGFEESNGLFGTKSDVKKLLDKKLIDIINVRDEYLCCLVLIDYDKELETKFRKDFLKMKKENPKKIDKDGLYEKDMVRWIELDKLEDFYKCLKKNFKSVVKKLMLLNLKNNLVI